MLGSKFSQAFKSLIFKRTGDNLFLVIILRNISNKRLKLWRNMEFIILRYMHGIEIIKTDKNQNHLAQPLLLKTETNLEQPSQVCRVWAWKENKKSATFSFDQLFH